MSYTNVNASSQREYVERGAKFLDEHHPDWWREIDLGRLNLLDGCRCILGQLYNDRAVSGNGFAWAVTHFNMEYRSYQYGFVRADLNSTYEELDELWIEQIKIRWEALA